MLIRRLDPDLFFKEVIDQFKQILAITKNNVLVGIKKRLNFVDSSRVTWSITDNATNKSVDVGVSALHADTATTSTTASALVDGDYGDIVVSGTGAVMTVDANTISDTKLRDSSAISVIGRSANSSGDPGDIAAASPGDVLRVAGAPPVLGFGSIPESSVTNLVTDLAGKVPTTRNINTTSPITGGGDLSADRTLAFDSSVLLDNNARVKVYKNTVAVGVRRELNFIEGTNITLTLTDDAINDRVDVEIDSSGGGSGLTHPEVMSRILQLC